MFIQQKAVFLRIFAGVLVFGTLVAAAPAHAKPTNSILTGALIVGVGLKSPPIDTTSTPPTPIVTLDFSGIPYQTVNGNIIPTSLSPLVVTPSVTIRWPDGTVFGTFTDTCLDSPTLSAVMTSSGTFDPVTGNITGLALTITRQHAVAPTTGTMYGTALCNGSARDVITVTLSTTGSGGAALNAAGGITLVGMASVVTPTTTSPMVPVSVSGTLAPLPDRTLACSGVTVPDVTELKDMQTVRSILQSAGLQPVFHYVGGPSIRDPYISFQKPGPDSCVQPGTIVNLTVRPGPVP